MTGGMADFAAFIKDNVFLAAITVLAVGLVIYLLTSTVLSSEEGPLPPLPSVPALGIAPIDPIPGEVQKPEPAPPAMIPPVIVKVRPAQIGVPDMRSARESAFKILNAVDELRGLSSGIKAGFFFYIMEPDGTVTELPASNLSFTLESEGRVRMGIAQGCNVKVTMPASRLEDLDSDLCQALSDMMQNDEIIFDLTSLEANAKMDLVYSMMPIARRCRLD